MLTPKQQTAVTMVQENPVSILTGAPGVGKTYTCKAIIEQAREAKQSILLAAPSGKAAKRLSEATSRSASTIHKLLEAQMDNGTFFFQRNEKYPLDANLIILDEVSMVSNQLMCDFLKAVSCGTTVLFVGDQYQLPSVGPGAVLRDFLASGKIPHVELTEIQRNSGNIVESCHKIKDGQFYTPSSELDLDKGMNLRHIEARNPAQIKQIIKELVVTRLPARGFNPVWDIQVLSPTNKMSDVSCLSLNTMLQAELNPNPAVDGIIFRKGDKVINTKNGQVGDAYIVNGDMGLVLDIDRKHIKVKFFNPDREVEIGRKMNNLLLGYSITGHRYQGSEAPVIVIPVHKALNYVVNRPWIYTSISRAKSICITVGQMSAIHNAIRKEGANLRVTRLEERLSADSN